MQILEELGKLSSLFMNKEKSEISQWVPHGHPLLATTSFFFFCRPPGAKKEEKVDKKDDKSKLEEKDGKEIEEMGENKAGSVDRARSVKSGD